MRCWWLAPSLVVLFGCSSSASPSPLASDAAGEVYDDPTDALVDTYVADSAAPEAGGKDALSDASDSSDAGPSDGFAETSSAHAVLRVHYPAAGHTLSVRGSSGTWTWTKGVAMAAGSDDTWTLETDALTGDTEWKPLLDDATWSRGPNYHVHPGDRLDVYPHFTVVSGTVTRKWPAFHSTVLGNDRGVLVYLPPTYLENTRASLPVVYMHDGQNLFDASTAFGGVEWQVDETMNAAAEDGSIREAIIIGVENTSARMSEYTPTVDASVGDGGRGDLYLKMLATELKPMVDKELRTLPGRETTAMVGSSLGGLISSYAGTTSSDTFALLGAMSPSTWWDSRVILTDVAATKGKTPRPLRVYVDSGDSGTSSDDVANTKILAQTYRDVGFTDGVDLKYVVQKGASHSEYWWAQRLPGALQFLLGKGR